MHPPWAEAPAPLSSLTYNMAYNLPHTISGSNGAVHDGFPAFIAQLEPELRWRKAAHPPPEQFRQGKARGACCRSPLPDYLVLLIVKLLGFVLDGGLDHSTFFLFCYLPGCFVLRSQHNPTLSWFLMCSILPGAKLVIG